MTVQPISSLGYTEPSLYTTEDPSNLDQADFLTLLIAQLQQQDPLNPQDPSEFTSQLTQFSSLDEMISMGTTLETMNDSIIGMQMLQMATNNTQAASLIGRDVVYEGDALSVADGVADEIRLYADEDMTSTQVTIRYAHDDPDGMYKAGDIARTIDLGGVTAGSHSYELEDLGVTVPEDGSYTVTVTGSNAAGEQVDATTLVVGRATGVIFENGQTFLRVGDLRVALNDIYSVYEAGTSDPALTE